MVIKNNFNIILFLKALKNKINILRIIALLLTFITSSSFIVNALTLPIEEISVMKEEIIDLSYDADNAALINTFQSLLENLFLNRNSAILTGDSEGLKEFYDLNKKVGVWAYENETTKIKYFSNWCEKQGVNFSKINSIIKVTKAKEQEKNLFGVICYVSTNFTYVYNDEPTIENNFKLGTCHYLNLRNDDGKYVIVKEWYTDPLADSLNLENIKYDEIKNYIITHKKPDYTLDERTQKAIDYAHKYCGIYEEEGYLFKYNKNYKNFNPEGGDCANFASQIMYEGGQFKKNTIWDYNKGSATKCWINAQGFKNYLVNSGRASYISKGNYQETYKSSFQLRPGDIVAYEKKGKITHVSTVTGLDSKGYPLVTCHNTDRLLVPYDLGWSNSNIRFHFIDVHY